MIFLIITIIVFVIIIYNKVVEPNQFIKEIQPLFKFLLESDYEFLLKLKYGVDIDVNKMFGQRVRNGLIGMVAMFFLFLSQMQFVCSGPKAMKHKEDYSNACKKFFFPIFALKEKISSPHFDGFLC